MGRFPQHDRGAVRSHAPAVLHMARLGGSADTRRFLMRSYTVRCAGWAGVCRSGEDSLWVRALERLSYESAQAWKSLFAYQFIVRARRNA